MLSRRSFLLATAWGIGTPLMWQWIWPRPVFAQEYGYPLHTLRVASSGELAKALSIADPGVHIVLAPGTYSGDFKATRSGDPAAPVVIRAEDPLKAKIDGSLSLAGSDITVHSLVAEGNGDYAVKMGGSGNKVMRSSFPGSHGIAVEDNAKDWYAGYNEFTGDPSGSEARQDAIIVYTDSGSGAAPGVIERNFLQSTDSGDSESHGIYIGQQKMDSRPSIDIAVRENLLGTPDQPYGKRRLIYCKHGCTIEGNTVYARRGTCGIRHGEQGRLSGNYIDGTHDVMLNGAGHEAVGNVIKDSRFDLMAETRSGSGANGGRGNLYQAADEAIVQGNTGTLNVGKRLVHLDRCVRGVKVSDHQGQVNLLDEEGTTNGGGGLGTTAATQVAVLTEADVGPGAQGSPGGAPVPIGDGTPVPDLSGLPDVKAEPHPVLDALDRRGKPVRPFPGVRMHQPGGMPDVDISKLLAG